MEGETVAGSRWRGERRPPASAALPICRDTSPASRPPLSTQANSRVRRWRASTSRLKLVTELQT